MSSRFLPYQTYSHHSLYKAQEMSIKKILFWGLFLLLALATAVFVLRGVHRSFALSIDFTGPYTSARAWLQGLNPYDRISNAALLIQTAPHRDFVTRPVYPPSTFPVLAPLAALPWSLAQLSLLGLSVGLFGLSCGALIRWTNLQASPLRSLGFLAFAVAFAPVHTGLAWGQLAIPAGALVILSLWCSTSGRSTWAGLLLGISLALKPQLGIPFILYFGLTKRWFALTLSLLVPLVAMVAGLIRLEMIADGGLNLWLSSVEQLNWDVGLDNPERYGRLNLHVVLHWFWEERTTVSRMVLLLLSFPGFLWAWQVLRRRTTDELLKIAPLISLSLLAFNHRPYDAILLLMPLAWAIANLGQHYGTLPGLTLVLLIPFLIPGSSFLEALVEAGYVPETISSAWWWHFWIMPYPTWLLLALAGVHLWGLRKIVSRKQKLVNAG